MGFFAQNLLDSPYLRFFPFITPGFSPILSGRTSGVLFKHPSEIEVICVTAALPYFPNLAVAFPEKLDGVAHPHLGQIGGEAFLLGFFEHLTDVVLVKAEKLRDFSYLCAPAKEISVYDYTQVIFAAILGFFMNILPIISLFDFK